MVRYTVRFFDTETSLTVIKVPRVDCDLVRSAVTFLTQIKDEPVTAVVLATSGSARTAKIAVLRHIKKIFRMKYSGSKNIHLEKKDLQKLESLFGQVRAID